MKILKSLLLIIFLSQPASAGELKKPFVLSLRQVLTEIENNPSLVALEKSSAAKKYAVGYASALEDPRLMLELEGYPSSGKSPSASENAANKITLSQEFPFPGKISTKKEIAELEYKISSNEFLYRKNKLEKEVKVKYFSLAFLQEKKRILDEQIKFINNSQVIARNRYELNNGSQVDILALQVAEAKLISEKISLEKELEVGRFELIQKIGKTDLSEFITEKLTFIKVDLLSQVELREKALNNNYLMKIAKENQNFSSAKVRLANLSYYPNFDVSMSYSAQSNSANDDEFGAGVGISFPLWGKSKQANEIKQTEEELASAKLILKDLENELVNNVQQKVIELNKNLEKISLFDKALLPLTSTAIVSASKAYEVGGVQLSDLLSLIQNKFESEILKEEAILSYQVSAAELMELCPEINKYE